MAQNELPTGIERLLTRLKWSCSEPEFVRIRQCAIRQVVREVADAHEDGWELLREGAVAQLADEEADMIDRALSVLFVVGNASEAAAVEPLLSHPDQRVRKAARTCLFEIRRRS